MANSFSFVVCVAVAVSSITGKCREGLQVLILRPACAEVSMILIV